MSLLISDPMVNFPTHPQLLPNIEMIVEEAITVSGSVDGPFRLNGLKAKEIAEDLMPILKKGALLENIYKESKFSNSEVDQLLEILFIKSCLMQKTNLNSLKKTDYFYLRKISKYKNHKSLEEFKAYLSSSYIYITGNDKELIGALKAKFETHNIQVIDTEKAADLQLNSTKSPLCIYITESFDEITMEETLSHMDILYVNPLEQQIGPLFSTKGIMPKEYIKTLEQLKVNTTSEEKNKHEFLNYITLYALREFGKISNSSLIEGFYKKENRRLRYYAVKSKLYEHDEPSILNYERYIQFPASKFINSSSHLAHYKSKNLKLSTYNQVSFLWKKIQATKIPQEIDELIRKTIGYKNSEFHYKRYTPSGGNINSNLIFYLNNDEDAFNGKGIYFYNNTDDSYYQILDDAMLDITHFYKLVGDKISTNAKGYLIIGNDVDIVAEKYDDFSFKISNLNTGIVLSNILSISRYLNFPLRIHTKFDEKSILHLLGIEKSNEIVNFVVEVK